MSLACMTIVLDETAPETSLYTKFYVPSNGRKKCKIVNRTCLLLLQSSLKKIFFLSFNHREFERDLRALANRPDTSLSSRQKIIDEHNQALETKLQRIRMLLLQLEETRHTIADY